MICIRVCISWKTNSVIDISDARCKHEKLPKIYMSQTRVIYQL